MRRKTVPREINIHKGDDSGEGEASDLATRVELLLQETTTPALVSRLIEPCGFCGTLQHEKIPHDKPATHGIKENVETIDCLSCRILYQTSSDFLERRKGQVWV